MKSMEHPEDRGGRRAAGPAGWLRRILADPDSDTAGNDPWARNHANGRDWPAIGSGLDVEELYRALERITDKNAEASRLTFPEAPPVPVDSF